jgi:hypothetical protein
MQLGYDSSYKEVSVFYVCELSSSPNIGADEHSMLVVIPILEWSGIYHRQILLTKCIKIGF